MAVFTYDQIFAVDPSNPDRVASNGLITIYAPGDTSRTPLALTTPNGSPVSNPVQVNAQGFGPAFTHPTLDRVAWYGGGMEGFFTSYEGIKNVAVAAQVAAEDIQRRIMSGELGGGGSGTALPAGGTAGQSLVKKSAAYADIEWKTITGGSGGGAASNVLVLGVDQPIPAGTPSGTVIIRMNGAEVVTPDPGAGGGTPATGIQMVSGSVVTATALNSKDLVISRPANIAAGDMLVAVVHNHASGGSHTMPAGWEVLNYFPSSSAMRYTAIMGYRVTNPASVPATLTFSYSSAGRMVGGIFRVTGAATSGAMTAGASLESVNLAQSAEIPSFSISAKSLVIVAGQTQVTNSQTWPLPTALNLSGFSNVIDKGNDESNRASATNSVLSVFVGVLPAGTVPQAILTWGATGGARGAIAAAVRSA